MVCFFSVLSRDFASGLLPLFLIIKVILFFIALCVTLFYEFLKIYIFVFKKLILDCVPPSFSTFGKSTLQGSFNLSCFSFFLSSVSFGSFFFLFF